MLTDAEVVDVTLCYKGRTDKVKRQLFYSLLATAAGAGLALTLAWLSAAAPAQAQPAATRNVNCSTGSNSGDCTGGPCKTIQYAIDQSSFGDTVIVASGICTEHITMKDGVSVHGQGWVNTTVTGNYTGSAPTVYMSSVGASTVLSGVYVTGGGTGITNTSTQDGGGIAIWYASPTIVNTWVQNNTAYNGGGVFVRYGSPTFTNVPVWLNGARQRGGGFYMDGAGEIVVADYSWFADFNGTVALNTAGWEGGGFFISGVTTTLGGLRIWGNTAQTQNGGGVNITNAPCRTSLWLNQIYFNSAHNGGGVAAHNVTQLDILLNDISGNVAAYDGGGLFFAPSTGVVQLSLIKNNRAGSSGGGVAAWSGTTGPALLGNWFEGNSASTGGGLAVAVGAAPLIDSNTIVTNSANTGGGFSLYQAGAVTITNNIVARNVASATQLGGGLIVDGSPARIVNNTIAHNTGDGILFQRAEGVAIVNNIISGNTGDGIEHYSDTMWVSPTVAYTADYNDVWANSSTAYYGLLPGPHDRSVNPQFVATGPNLRAYYHIQNSSPISTAGSVAWAPARDIDGDLRILGGTVSMGADEIALPEYATYLPLLLRNAGQ